jgi:hypothetical protein
MTARSALTRSLGAWVTSNADGTEHAVTDEQMTAGRTGRSGVYLARCELQFVAAPMVTPALRRCTDCLLLLTPARVVPPHDGLLTRWTSRLLHLLQTPVTGSPHPEGGDPASRPNGSHGAVAS